MTDGVASSTSDASAELRALSLEPVEQTTSCQIVLDLCLFLILFVTPWLISTEFKEVFNTTKNCFVGFVAVLMALVFLVESIGKGEILVPRLKAFWFIGLLAAWMTLSLVWGQSFNCASRDWGFHMAVFTVFSVTLISVTSRERMENFLHFAIAAGVVVSGYATLQYYGFDERIFTSLSKVLFWEDASRLLADGRTPIHGGILSWILSYETAHWLHGWVDLRFLILPSKPEEPSKNYSFMGHRNYLAGYVIALIPLVLSRLLAHLDVLLKELPKVTFYRRRMIDAMQILGVVFVSVFVLSFPVPMVRLLALVLGAALVLCLISNSLVRAVFVYLASLILMFVTVLQTHTRGAWIGLGFGIPFLVIVICWKELRRGVETKTPSRGRSPEEPPTLPPEPGVVGQTGQPAIERNQAGPPTELEADRVPPELEADRVPPTLVPGTPPPFPAGETDTDDETRAIWKGILLRFVLLFVGLILKVKFVGRSWSWLPLLAVFVELIVHYAVIAFRPRFLHRASLILAILPLFLVSMAFNWKSIDFFGHKLANPFNKEWVSALDRLDDTFKFGVSSSTHQRWLIYRTTWKIITDNPWNFFFGTGIGTFGLHYMPYQAKFLNMPGHEALIPEVNKSIYAHDEYLHYWSEIGLIGMLLFVLTVFFFCKVVFTNLIECELNYDTLLYIGILSSILAVMAHIFFSFCLHLAYTATLFYCMAAFALRFFPCPVIRLSMNPRIENEGEVLGVPFHVGLELTPWGRAVAWVRMLSVKGLLTNGIEDGASSMPRIVLTVTEPSGKTFEQPLASLPVSSPLRIQGQGLGQALFDRDALPGTYRYRVTCGKELVLGEGEIHVAMRGRLPQVVAAGVLSIVASIPCQSMTNVLMAEYHWRAAYLKFRLQKFEESFLDFSKAVECDGGKGEILFDYGRALMDSGRNTRAVKLFGKATANFVDPANYHNMALCYYKEATRTREKGQGKESAEYLRLAETAYRNALSQNLIYEQALSNLIFMLLDRAQEEREKAADHLREAEHLAHLGVRHYRGNSTFWTALGVVQAREDKSEDAILPLVRALDMMLLERGRRRYAEVRNDLELQRGNLSRLLSRPPDSVTTDGDLSRGREIEGKVREYQGLAPAIDDTVKRAQRLFGDAVKLHEQAFPGKPISAEKQKKAFESSLEAYLTSMTLLEAIPGLTTDPSADKIRINLSGIFQRSRNDPVRALAILEGVADRSDPSARERYLSLLVSHFNKLLGEPSANSSLYLDYARRLTGWGFDADATKVLYRLLDRDKVNKEALFLLAECLYRQKYREESIREYRRLLGFLSPDDELARRVKERIDLIEGERGKTPPTTQGR